MRGGALIWGKMIKEGAASLEEAGALLLLWACRAGAGGRVGALPGLLGWKLGVEVGLAGQRWPPTCFPYAGTSYLLSTQEPRSVICSKVQIWSWSPSCCKSSGFTTLR